MSISSTVQSNTSPVKNINIVERYSFRGRRKFNPTDIEEENKTEKSDKQRKLNDFQDGNSNPNSDDNNTVIFNEKSNQNLNSIGKQEKNSAKTKPDCRIKTTKVIKSRKPVESKTKNADKEIDIEDCEATLSEVESEMTNNEEKVKWVPENWEEMFNNIREMRKDQTAPVDDMGCHKTMDENASPKVKRYQALVSLMLSSQTKDQTTYATMLRLREHGLTIDNILNTPESQLAELIKTVGFWRVKAKNIKRTTQILKDEYNGDIPDTIEKMLLLPGVGPKMANLCMTTAWGKIHGIGVDTHVHRISNRLKWVKKPTNNPEQTRIALESWLPPALWFEVNHLMVGFGQQICLPRFPKCSGCINNKLCPFGRKELRGKPKTD